MISTRGAIAETAVPIDDILSARLSWSAAQKSPSLPASDVASPGSRQSLSIHPRAEEHGWASRLLVAKTLLFAFGPLFVLAALGLIGARMAPIDTRASISSGEAHLGTSVFVEDGHVSGGDYHHHD
jgi:hypothetical protein